MNVALGRHRNPRGFLESLGDTAGRQRDCRTWDRGRGLTSDAGSRWHAERREDNSRNSAKQAANSGVFVVVRVRDGLHRSACQGLQLKVLCGEFLSVRGLDRVALERVPTLDPAPGEIAGDQNGRAVETGMVREVTRQGDITGFELRWGTFERRAARSEQRDQQKCAEQSHR